MECAKSGQAEEFVRKARPSFWSLLLLLMSMLPQISVISGCAGVVSGKTAPNTPPPQSFSISGTVSPATGGSGTTVALSGAASATAIADNSGNYAFTGLANGAYIITPSHAGYTMSPSSQSATISGANVSGVNFTAAAQTGQTFSISGAISPTV